MTGRRTRDRAAEVRRPGGGGPIDAWTVAVALSTVFSIVVNVLAVTLPLAGRDTAEISAMYPTLVEPAGYVFSIWSLIYLGLIGYTVWQFLPRNRGLGTPARSAAPAVVVVNVLNGLWLVAWHHLWLGTSVVIMVALLLALIGVYLALRHANPAPDEAIPRGERILARGTFSVYLGWITIATVANVSIYLVALGWRGWPLPAEVWAIVVIAIATLLGVRMLRRYRDLAYAAVLVWAFVGIVVARPSVHTVAAAAILGVVTLLFTAAAGAARPRYTAPR